MQHPVHVTTHSHGLPQQCNIWPMYDSQYRLATRFTCPRLTQRTVKTRISIYRLWCPSNAASSPHNDSLLWTTLALQQLAYVRLAVWASNQIYPPPLTQHTVKTRTLISTPRPTSAARNDCPAAFNDSTNLSFLQQSSSCIQWLDRPQLTRIKHLAVSPRLDLRQLPASNIQLCAFTARPYQLSTSPI